MTVIRVDEDVYKALQKEAKKRGMEFASSNNVIRAVMGLPLNGRKKGHQGKKES